MDKDTGTITVLMERQGQYNGITEKTLLIEKGS